MGNERELGLRIFSLYAQARVAFQLGGDMLPTARRRAREALVLLEQLDRGYVGHGYAGSRPRDCPSHCALRRHHDYRGVGHGFGLVGDHH